LEEPAKTQDPGSGELQEVDDAAIVVETACPSCGFQGHVPEKFLGKKVKCRKCSNFFTVTQEKDTPAEADGDAQDVGGAAEPDDLAIVVETVCPSCGSKGLAPEKVVGKNVKCRKCSTQFTVTKPAPKKPVAALPTEVEAAEEPALAPRKPRRRCEDDDDNKWPIGVIVAGSSIVVVVIAGLITCAVLFLRPAGDSEAKLAEIAQPVRRDLPPRANPPQAPVDPVTPPVKTRLSFDDWLQDFEQAKRQATESKKDILVLFDGSDWCGFSIRMAHDVLFRPEFKQEVTQKFVLVLIDFPRKPSALAKVQDAARNERLMRQFGIQGFPTFVLTDSEGRPYAGEGYMEGGPAPFLQALTKHQGMRVERDRLLTAIAQASGVAKLASAKEALTFLAEKGLMEHHQSLLDTWNDLARENDPSNEHGYLELFFGTAWMRDLDRTKDLGGALKLVEQLEASKKTFRFKDGNRGAGLHLIAATILNKAGKKTEALRHVNDAIAYKPADPELKRDLAIAKRALELADEVPDARFEAGTGFVIAPGGYVLTNSHVIEGKKGKIKVRLPGVKEPVPADIVAADDERDMALIQIKALDKVKGLKPLLIAGNRAMSRGEKVAALGYPGGSSIGGGLKLTTGVISAIPERGTGQMLLLDIKVNPGNSGGPLCDSFGNVVGMVTRKTGASRIVESYGMAIPGKDLEEFLQKNLKSFKSATANRKPLEWNQVDKLVSPSVLMILNTAD
jgi:S1-C subfamily serine protease